MIRELATHLLASVPRDDIMSCVARVSGFDRYQASLGIGAAAELVASLAESWGVRDVAIEHLPADGKPHWWSFRAPVAWTPITARLAVLLDGQLRLELDHALQPFTIATYSAPTPPEGIFARLTSLQAARDHRGRRSVVMIDAGDFARPGLMAELVTIGAIGFITDTACRGSAAPHEFSGRIELDPGSKLFGFSIVSSQFAALRCLAEDGAQAHVTVTVDHSARMPVVTGVLPGERPGAEVWLTAHLCHPRPGANDNASGVAALLGVAANLTAASHESRRASRRDIRFVWAPEFVGTAALLHRQMARFGPLALPQAVINLDMVGENQVLCGGPFVVERPPDFRSSLITPVAERIVDEVFAQTSAAGGRWHSTPLAGASDHAIFAHANTGSPAIHFCHTTDHFNHSAGDSLDKVCADEMVRATVAATALADIVASDYRLSSDELQVIVTAWCDNEDRAARRIAAQYGDSAWGTGLMKHVGRQNSAMTALANGAVGSTAASASQTGGGRPIAALWDGPINVRAMLQDAPAAVREAAASLLQTDRRNYALLFNMAIRADGSRSRDAIINETSFCLRRPVDADIAACLFDVIMQSGWAKEAVEHVPS